MLSVEDKNDLYTVIVAIVGEDRSLLAYKPGFNSNTVEVVEDLISEAIKCNSNLRELVTDLLGGTRILVKGWLRRSLNESAKRVRKMNLRGQGCMVSIKSRWKSVIILSTTNNR